MLNFILYINLYRLNIHRIPNTVGYVDQMTRASKRISILHAKTCIKSCENVNMHKGTVNINITKNRLYSIV